LRLNREAKTQLTREGRFDTLNVEDNRRAALGLVKGTCAKEPLVKERAFGMAQQRVGIPEEQPQQLPIGAANQMAFGGDPDIARAADSADLSAGSGSDAGDFPEGEAPALLLPFLHQ
jgi:hypothetical protein